MSTEKTDAADQLKQVVGEDVQAILDRDTDGTATEHQVVESMLRHHLRDPGYSHDADLLVKAVIENTARAVYHAHGLRRALKALPLEGALAYEWRRRVG